MCDVCHNIRPVKKWWNTYYKDFIHQLNQWLYILHKEWTIIVSRIAVQWNHGYTVHVCSSAVYDSICTYVHSCFAYWLKETLLLLFCWVICAQYATILKPHQCKQATWTRNEPALVDLAGIGQGVSASSHWQRAVRSVREKAVTAREPIFWTLQSLEVFVCFCCFLCMKYKQQSTVKVCDIQPNIRTASVLSLANSSVCTCCGAFNHLLASLGAKNETQNAETNPMWVWLCLCPSHNTRIWRKKLSFPTCLGILDALVVRSSITRSSD